MKLSPDQSIAERMSIIEDALAKVLDRDSSMFVSTDSGERFVTVTDPDDIDALDRHSLYWIARELEALLS